MPLSLARSEVLLLDCQTTGATPARGQVLEIAWCRTTARDLHAGRRPEVESHLVAVPAGERLPRRITTVTGIGHEDLAEAAPESAVWAQVRSAIGELQARADPVPVVAHFARFERAFIDDLHTRHGSGTDLPVDWICTHEIVCRLLPGLPRRGLKAVAGHFGHVVREGKRAAEHVEATLDVWSELVARLEHDAGVDSLARLRAWLDHTRPARRGGREFAVAREDRLRLPDGPGVYRMLGSRRQLLYVGKATSLRRRVNSYFQKRRHAAERTLEMLTQVYDVEVTETASPLEAALLESDLIKEHAPPYNVALRGRSGVVSFGAADLRSVSPDPGPLHRLGPLPHRGPLDAWGALALLLTDTGPAAERRARFRAVLGVREDVPLDLVCAETGLEAFSAEHGLRDACGPLHRRLLGLGARLHRERREALAAAQAAAQAEADESADEEDAEEAFEDGEEEAGDDESPREPWSPQTPEQVVSVLRGTVSHGARLIRRGHWLRQLSECMLVWQPHGRSAGAPRRLLAVSDGAVELAEDAAPDATAPLPPGHGRTAVERALSFDVATYDRLRVLTTELRRLVATGRPVQVCLGPRHDLDRDGLRRRLFWI